MTSIFVVGNVGNVRVFENSNGQGGKTVLFSVAVNTRTANKEEKSPPVWYSFRAVGALAEVLSLYLTKGRLVAVVGSAPRVRSFEVERVISVPNIGNIKFKETRQDTEYLVTDLQFLDAPPATNGQTNQVLVGELVTQQPQPQAQVSDVQATTATATQNVKPTTGEYTVDLPF